jgi:hypothetical protein
MELYGGVDPGLGEAVEIGLLALRFGHRGRLVPGFPRAA